jgi:hypothetical protein
MDYSEFSPSLVSELANHSAAYYLKYLLGNQLKYIINDNPNYKEQTIILIVLSSHHLTIPEYTFLMDDYYSSNTFIGLLIDTGAAEILITRYTQYLTYRKVAKNVIINTLTARAANIRFGAGKPLKSLGSIDIKTLIGTIQFYVVEATTSFLLCIKDLNQLKVYYNNMKDLFICYEPYMTAPVVQRFSHPFLI